MNIASTSTITKPADSSASTSSSSASTQDSSTSFKGELEAAKSQDSAETTDTKTEAAKLADAKTSDAKAQESAKTESNNAAQKTSEDNVSQQVKKDQLTASKDKTTGNFESSKFFNPIEELNSQLAALNDLKNVKTQGAKSKSSEKASDKGDYCQTIQMDNKDITLFMNLVQNQQMIAHNHSGIDPNSGNKFTDIKTEGIKASVPVSETLMSALNDSAKTGKSIRIDFDSNVAVIMKVDKNGTISANFIPGDAAVENYLKNNIAGLRQSFDDQGLPYNQLSYSKQPRQDQEQGQRQSNNKENENE